MVPAGFVLIPITCRLVFLLLLWLCILDTSHSSSFAFSARIVRPGSCFRDALTQSEDPCDASSGYAPGGQHRESDLNSATPSIPLRSFVFFDLYSFNYARYGRNLLHHPAICCFCRHCSVSRLGQKFRHCRVSFGALYHLFLVFLLRICVHRDSDWIEYRI